MITLNRRSLSAIAKSVSGEMKHTEKLDAIARALGYKDQTAIMAALKAAEAAAPVAPSDGMKSARMRFSEKFILMATRRLREVRDTPLYPFDDLAAWMRVTSSPETAEQDYAELRDYREDQAALLFCTEMNKALDATSFFILDPVKKGAEVFEHLTRAIRCIHRGTGIEHHGVLNVEANDALRDILAIVSKPDEKSADALTDALDKLIMTLDPKGRTAPSKDPYPCLVNLKEWPAGTEVDRNLPDAGNAVMAFVHSDDRRIEISVDARHFLRDATAEEIRDLLDCDCRGDYAADQIFHAAEVAGDEAARKLIDYLNSGVRMPNGDPMGFEVVAWPDEVRDWLGEHRPEILAAAETGNGPRI